MKVFQIKYILKPDKNAPIFGVAIIADDFGDAERVFNDLNLKQERILAITPVAKTCYISDRYNPKPAINFTDKTAVKSSKKTENLTEESKE